MTYRKYLRLCLVLVVPLLLLGIVTFKFLVPYPGRTAIVMCEERSPIFESCRYVGDFDSSIYRSIKEQRDSWVGLRIGERKSNGEVINLIEATGRIFHGAKIVVAEPFVPQKSEVREFMQRMVGRSVTAIWGNERTVTSVMSEQSATIFCNDVTIEGRAGRFKGSCFGDGWSGLITFDLSGLEEERLERLRNKASEELRARENDYLIYRVIAYPIFIYLFLFASGLVWLIRKAARFVARG